MTRIPLKPICDQLTDAMGLVAPLKVAALIDFVDGEAVLNGWQLVVINEDGKMTPTSKQYKDIKEMFENNHFRP